MEITRALLDSIIEFNPGDFAIYQMNGGKLRTIYYSPELFRHPGMERDEYDRIIRDDASAIIIDSDKNQHDSSRGFRTFQQMCESERHHQQPEQ